jgi:hypothetical protein
MKLSLKFFFKVSSLQFTIFILFHSLKSNFFKTSLYNIQKEINGLEKINFNITTDLIAFLHLPKTGGTNFELNIVNYLQKLDINTKKWVNACLIKPQKVLQVKETIYAKYYCPRDEINEYKETKEIISNSWFFSRQTFGWGREWQCGVHSDFSKFKFCSVRIKKENLFLKKIHLITVIREPMARYVSEWSHVERKTRDGHKIIFSSTNFCNKEVIMAECLANLTIDFKNITLEKFTLCQDNLASNRQTRLLADYDESEPDCKLFKPQNKNLLLLNAKKVLTEMSYFALTEYDVLSRKLFEKTFQNLFKFKEFKEKDSKFKYKTSNLLKTLDERLVQKIRQLNDLDLELYDYAKKLFFERLNSYGIHS